MTTLDVRFANPNHHIQWYVMMILDCALKLGA
jgi:hypothetical protein